MPLRLTLTAALLPVAMPALAASHTGDGKLDRELRLRAHAPGGGHSRVIVRLAPGADADAIVNSLKGTVGRRLGSVDGQVAEVPDQALDALAAQPAVQSVSLDRRVEGTLERTGATVGSPWVRQTLGFDGTGVSVAIIDSGVASWHDDLGSERVIRFVDFVNFEPAAYDDYGHGTHVAGIIAGSGYDSGGRRSGIAPGASLVVEKVLDATGHGYISNVIAAIDYAIANRDALRIRVINLSVAAGVYESYNTDPLALAARRAVEAGIVVVSAAGNLGKNDQGRPQYGGVGVPGNAPWVITVGASNHMGTPQRGDDTVAVFSSRGPGAIDYQAKPDLVAPGVGIESLADPGSTLYLTKPAARLWGTVTTATEPYLALTGTSMASPVVSGTIALMLQANPALTPNLVKAVLQYTAETKSGYNGLTEGAGFLNARGAVELAQALATGRSLARSRQRDPSPWNAHITWGNHRIDAGVLDSRANAWRTDVTWGSQRTPEGAAVAWGAACSGLDCSDSTAAAKAGGDNVVWGMDCGGADCKDVVWGTSGACDAAAVCDDTVWGAVEEGEDIVWATSSSGPDDGIIRTTNVPSEHENVWNMPAIRPRSYAAVMVSPVVPS